MIPLSPALWLLYTAACYRFPVAEYWPLVALLTLAEHTATEKDHESV